MEDFQPTETGEKGLSRRKFLERLFTATVASAVDPSVIFGQITPHILRKAGSFSGFYVINLNSVPVLQTIGGSIRLTITQISSGFRIIVTRVSETEFEAVNAQCPHQGAKVKAREGSNNYLECEAHQSLFQFNGTYISGPADGRNLTRYNTTFDGNSTVRVEIDSLAGIEEAGGSSAAYVAVHSVGPLPSQVVFEFGLDKAGPVTLGIWSLDGREALRILDGEYREAGTYRLPCDTSSLADGLYLYRLTAPDRVIGTGKLLIGR